MHPVTEEGARGVTAYLPGKDEVRGHSCIFLAFFFIGHGVSDVNAVLRLAETLS